jgi:hypothetical protein
MRDFGMRDITVRARRTGPVADHPARIQIVDAPLLKVIRLGGWLHHQVFNCLRAPYAERAYSAISRIFSVEYELLPESRAKGIEATNSRIMRGPRRDNRPADHLLRNNPVEVPGGSNRIRNVLRV